MYKTILFIITLTTTLLSQDFTKITDGEIVNDGGYSFGVSWGDLNGDGLVDLYVSNGGADSRRDKNFFYINDGDGTFTKAIGGDLVDIASKSIGATLVDYDNDGDLDVFVANRDGGNNLLFSNNGNNNFSAVSGINITTDGGNSNGSSWTDYNNDGLPDLFVTNFFEQAFLYTNNGNGTFSKAFNRHPARESNTSISVAWGDLDNDQDPDLFIPNAAGAGKENYLYKNNETDFELINSGSIVSDKRASMGGTWGDFNNDGFLDLFVANQADFENDLYVNNGDGSFTAIRDGEIVNEKSFSISGSFADVDNDGDLDLYVTNWVGNQNFLYLNSGYPDYLFEKATDYTVTADFESSMGAAWADYDNDGDLDLFVANRDDRNNNFFRNENRSGAWATISLTGTASGKSALVSKVRVLAEIDGRSTWQVRELTAQHGYNSQNDIRAHFGLGDASEIDSVIVEWSSGEKEVFEKLPVNQFYEAVEGEGLSGVTSVNSLEQINKQYSLEQNYPNPFNPSTVITFTIPKSSHSGQVAAQTSLKIFNSIGQQVATLVNEPKRPGVYQVEFEAADLPSGVYFYTLIAGEYNQTKKMILLK